MPIYEYDCLSCGSFAAVRPMSEARLPQPCPECGEAAPRVILSAPACSTVSSQTRISHGINERSAHAPQTSGEYAAKKHGAGCSCCNPSLPKNRVQKNADGKKTFPDKRPWMISH